MKNILSLLSLCGACSYLASAESTPPVPPAPRPLPVPAAAAAPTPAPVPVPAPPVVAAEPPEAPEAPEATLPRADTPRPKGEYTRSRNFSKQIAQSTATAEAEAALETANAAIVRFTGADAASRRAALVGRTLVLPGNDTDAKKVPTLEDDLTVMARLIEKGMAGKGEDNESRHALGIELHSLFGSATAPRNLYLDGYGALFLLRVKFPLLPPAKREEVEKPKDPRSNAWVEAQEELFNDRRTDSYLKLSRLASNGEPYDERKVNALKDTLLDLIKNATNIRHLKPTEWVTIVVAGPDTGRTERLTVRKNVPGALTVQSGDAGRSSETGRPISARGETTMMVRAKKADVDAVVAGSLTEEDFRKRALVLTY